MLKRSIRFTFIACVASLLAACGGSSSDAPPATGDVAVILTDGPTDVFERIEVSMTQMSLIGPGGHVDLYNGPEITFDLLEMSDWADLAFNTEVIAGQYNKIRIYLSGIKLIDLDEAEPDVMLDALPANGKIDLNPRGPFEVSPDYTTVIKLDMDANRSFQVVETGNVNWQLRPIFFVDVSEGDISLPERLVRVHGTVKAGSFENGDSFQLCDLQFVSQLGGPAVSGPEDCVRIYTDANTGIFDNSGMGLTGDFSRVMADQSLTAIGLIVDTEDPDAFLGLDAKTIGIGARQPYVTGAGWDTVQGVVASAPMLCPPDQCFDFDPAASDPAIMAHMQPATRVFRADGNELTQLDVTLDDVGSIDAFRADGASDFLAALIVLSTDDGGGIVSGILSTTSTDGAYVRLHVTQDAGGELLVCIDANTAIVQVIADDEVVTLFDLIDPAVLETGSLIEAFGDATVPGGAICDILADQVIVEPAP